MFYYLTVKYGGKEISGTTVWTSCLRSESQPDWDWGESFFFFFRLDCEIAEIEEI